LNLVWLKYVSWALLAGAAFFYFAIRLNKLGLSQTAKAILLSLCIATSCTLWHVQELNSDLSSPRQLVVGVATSVTAHVHRHGGVYDSFRLRLPSAATSQEFTTTDMVAEKIEHKPIHSGDLLGVLYRTWDDVPLTIDEIQGQNPGWHYQRFRGGLSVFIWTVAGTGIFALLGALIASNAQVRRSSQTAPGLNPPS
jgi:hypothetical protein